MAVALLLLVVPALGVVGLLAGLGRATTVTVADPADDDVRRLLRRSLRARCLGLVLGVVAAVVVADRGPGSLGIAVALALPSVVVVLLAVMCVGELTTPSVTAAVRTATLRRRRWVDAVPAGAARASAAATLLCAALLTTGWAMGDVDDAGRAGRWLTTVCAPATGESAGSSSSHGPWPGSFYAVPMLVALLVACGVAVATLVAISRRARPRAENAEVDDQLRRLAGRRVLLILGALGLAMVVPVAALMADGLTHVESCRPGWYVPFAVVLGVLAPLAAGLGAAMLGAATGPTRVVVVEPAKARAR